MKIISVVGDRPNFMKIAPFIQAIETHNTLKSNMIEHILLNTGQHYDERMSRVFFKQLEIPEPDINLDVGSGTHAEQVGQTMITFERVLKVEKPGWVVVVGDVNSTLACSVTAKKECVKCCHIEAGLRSGDLTMPEEINRLVTDRLSDLLLAPDMISVQNLKSEGVPESRIKFVGNIMIDTLEANRLKASHLDINEIIRSNLISPSPGIRNLESGTNGFAVITMHRPSNVDCKEVLEPIIRFLTDEVTRDMHFIWPVHPRTKKQLNEFGFFEKLVNHQNIILFEPLGYIDMLSLNMEAKIMFTDSGGLQEECTVLGTQSIIIHNSKSLYLLEQQNKYGLCYIYSESNEDQVKAINKGIELLNTPDIKNMWLSRREKMLAEKIDVTSFLVWFVENWPESYRIMKENPEYQERFRNGTKAQRRQGVFCNLLLRYILR